MTQPHASNIDYLKHSKALIGRPGRVLNIVTGCKHGCEPTFHPGRVKAVGPRSKWLLFLNDMGDCGCDAWFNVLNGVPKNTEEIANEMFRFAHMNPQHILLLLTKNPAWYGLVEWPENVWCGFSATNNEALAKRYGQLMEALRPGQEWWDSMLPTRWWLSLEPWLDEKAPAMEFCQGWTVIGGLSGKNPRPVSPATISWLQRPFDGKRFVKQNAFDKTAIGTEYEGKWPREYPDEWRME